MFASFEISDGIAWIFSSIDYQCRQELIAGSIISERDYVSTFSSKVRERFRRRNFVHAQTVPNDIETTYGIDGIIIFQIGNEVKIGIYEAKWPRFLQANYSWDVLHTVRLTSHFSEQINKQQVWKNVLTVWEMFFNEADIGTNSPPCEMYGSSCIIQNQAYDFMNREALVLNKWTTAKLKELLTKSGTNLYSIIFDMLSCKTGEKYPVDLKTKTAKVVNPIMPDIEFNVPIPFEQNGAEIDKRIDEFMRLYGLTSYLYINLDGHPLENL